jgi:Zn-finger nucleic acid-binding protein
MQCTLCEASCVAEPVGSIVLDRCSGCRALWSDRTELAAVLGVRVSGIAVEWGQPLPAPVDEGPLCPRTSGDRLHSYVWLGERFWRCSTCRGVLMTATAWQAMVATAERQLVERNQRSGAQAGVQLILEVLGVAFL